MAHLKRGIVEVMAEQNCLAHALVITVATLTNNSNFPAYRRRRKKILPKVNELLQAAGVDLSRGGGIPELTAFQRHLSEYRIVVSSSLRCDSVMSDGPVATSQRINLLYDDQHYHVITSLTAAMARRYVCPACKNGVLHRCNASCDACSAIPLCIQDNARIPLDECNRYFRKATCFENHKRLKISGKTVCEVKRRCECGAVEERYHECYKRYCSQYLKKRDLGHRCYISPLSDRASCSDKVLFVFYDFETTQNTKCSDNSFQHVPNLMCVQQICALCEGDPNVHVDCRRCGKRKEFLEILSAISFPTFSKPGPGLTGSWPLPIMPRPSTSCLYSVVCCGRNCCLSSPS